MKKENRVNKARAWCAALLVTLVGGLSAVGLAQVAVGADADANALFGSNEWLVAELVTPDGQFQLLPGDLAFFKLRADGSLAGTAGCNQMSAQFTLTGSNRISFGPAIATRMACPEPEMAQEFAILGALEHLTEYQGDSGVLVLTGGGYELTLVTRSPATTAPAPALPGPGTRNDALDHGKAVARYAASFNDAVAAAAAAGADWPSDPLRVALAFVELVGAPNVVVTRSDIGNENATKTVVTVIEDGLLDDSVAGLEQSVWLELADGVWSVSAYQGAWICHRSPGLKVSLPGVCS